MSRITPEMRSVAERLVAAEMDESDSAPAGVPVFFIVCAKLGPHLAALMGKVGFRALLMRSLALARAEVPWLRAVRVTEEGALEWVHEKEAPADPQDIAEGGIVLLARVLGLLVNFIGAGLTIRLVSEVWPKFSPGGLDYGKGAKNEKTK